MKPRPSTVHNIVYKWVPYCLVLGFVYYWFFTIGHMLFRKPVQKMMPRQACFYNAFLRQGWRLFDNPKNYNRKMNLVTRDILAPAQSDTIDLLQYCIAQKRKYAPFNNYEDALEHLLFFMMNSLETSVYNKKVALQKQFPGRPADFYTEQASKLAASDPADSANLQNIIALGKYILQKEKINVSGKECQLNLLHKSIPPQNLTAGPEMSNDIQTIFISAYRNF